MFKFMKRNPAPAASSAPAPAAPAPAAPATAAPRTPTPAPSSSAREQRLDHAQRATFAAGCFWGVEAALREIDGVLKTRVGYTGGQTSNPTYEQVCSHATGHAEAVDVWFDPDKVTYEQLLDTFWRIHNPTTLNRQGWDFGEQYRSAIFVHDADQAAIAAASRDREQEGRRKPIVTEITPAGEFHEAEDYHQQYFEKQDRAACAITLR
jgi:peptide-methionine (S)-S-oxide reductase